jgi:uncharacterized protein (DUF488 family)
MKRLFTIGAYGFDADHYFTTLQQAHIDLFLDIRRRRGVRGSEYAFANAGRLQQRLEELGILYRHLIELAPEQATRELQEREDEASRVARRKRTQLSETFIADYTRCTLDPFDFDALARELEGYERPVLFCVERAPEACHRSLVAARLAHSADVPVTHLIP